MILGRGSAGFTFTEFLCSMLVVVFAAMAALQLFPLYSEKFKVDTALEQMSLDPTLAGKDKPVLVDALHRRLLVSDVDRFSQPELMKLLSLKLGPAGERTLSLAYDLRSEFCCDLDVILKYRHAVDLPSGLAP